MFSEKTTLHMYNILSTMATNANDVLRLIEELPENERKKLASVMKKGKSARVKLTTKLISIINDLPRMSLKTCVGATRDAWKTVYPDGMKCVKPGSYQEFVMITIPKLKNEAKLSGSKFNQRTAMKNQIKHMWAQEKAKRQNTTNKITDEEEADHPGDSDWDD
jgi:hypothetical protein